MNYLILAAGIGKRMAPFNSTPKCLIRVNDEPLIVRLIRQIRENDKDASINLVLGYKHKEIERHVDNCNIILNPFFDITGIMASIWLARATFNDNVMMINGDIVFSDKLVENMITESKSSFMAYNSKIQNDKALNIKIKDGTVTRFGVKFKDYAGEYGGVINFSAEDAKLFINLIDKRITKGSNNSNSYYFHQIRTMIEFYQVKFASFDFGNYDSVEIDYAEDVQTMQNTFV